MSAARGPQHRTPADRRAVRSSSLSRGDEAGSPACVDVHVHVFGAVQPRCVDVAAQLRPQCRTARSIRLARLAYWTSRRRGAVGRADMLEIGGRQEARTPDLRVANAALSQLS
jgi:hypothetical protein